MTVAKFVDKLRLVPNVFTALCVDLRAECRLLKVTGALVVFARWVCLVYLLAIFFVAGIAFS